MTKALKLVDNKYRNQFLFIMFSSLLLSAIFFKLAIDNSAFELEMYDKSFIMKYGYYNVDAYTIFKIGSNTIRYSDNLINLMSGNVSIYLFGSLFTFIMTAMVGGIEKVTKFGIFIKTIPISRRKLLLAKTIYIFFYTATYTVISFLVTIITIYTSIYKFNGYTQDLKEVVIYFLIMQLQLMVIIFVMMFINSFTNNFIGHLFTAIPVFGGFAYVLITLAGLEFVLTHNIKYFSDILNNIFVDYNYVWESIMIPFVLIPIKHLVFFLVISVILFIIGVVIERMEEVELLGTVYKFKIVKYIFMVLLIVNISEMISLITGSLFSSVPVFLLFVIYCAILYMPIRKLFNLKIG